MSTFISNNNNNHQQTRNITIITTSSLTPSTQGVLVNDKSLKSLARAVGFLNGMYDTDDARPRMYVYKWNTGTVECTTELRVKEGLDAGR
jgi:hypothetical protein